MKLVNERPISVSNIRIENNGPIVAFIETDLGSSADHQEDVARRLATSWNVCFKYPLAYLELIAQSDVCVLPMVKHQKYLSERDTAILQRGTLLGAFELLERSTNPLEWQARMQIVRSAIATVSTS